MQAPERIGPYQVVRPLGRGAMGQVFEVRHPEVARPLALKLLPELFADEKGKARFAREAQLLARVRHRNVLPVHDAGEAPEGPWLVMEMVEGADLRAASDGRPLPGREAARLVAELAEGVAALHAQGILHRDLKPANVLLRAQGTPILIDFGLARAEDVERLTRTGDFLGTPAYMAPEQATGHPEPRSDVYGLGAILYHLLCGRAPFVANSPIGVFKALLHEPPPEPATLGVEVDPGLWEVCRRALEKDPQRRQPSAAALRDELRRWLTATRAAPARPRGRAGALVAGLGGLLVLAAGVGGLALARRPAAGGAASPAGPAPTLEVAPVASLTWDAEVELRVAVRGSGALKLHVSGRPLPERVRDGERLPYTVPLAEGPNALVLRLVDEAGREARVEQALERLPAPAWLRDPGRPRPPPPLPAGLRAGETAGVFLHALPAGPPLELVWIAEAAAREGPAAREDPAALAPFWLGRTEVTRAQWGAFAQATGRAPLPDDPRLGPLDGQHPVCAVSWQDATDWCGWGGLRLPSAAEWQRAARGDDERPYPWGFAGPLAPGGPFANLPEGDEFPGPAPVGSFPNGAAPCGALDLCGNVGEWTADEPTLVRGGAWVSPPTEGPLAVERFARSQSPFQVLPGIREVWIGFRAAR